VLTVTGLSDEELTLQALAADPDQPLPPDAVPFRDEPKLGLDLLPEWYMPRPALGRVTPTRRAVGVALVVAALVINGLGFCLTYGHLTAG
jgi:hypothetical protein